ncbi:MAG: hypothetical protein ACLFPE_02175 [Bacteroidales bacterium]
MSVRFSFLFLIIFIGSCNTATFDGSDRILARVYDSYLYVSDLDGLVPSGTNTIDSLSITRNYVNNWVRNQLLLYQAERNLADDQKDFSRQLEDYRNSLIIYAYESELIRQNLDTVVGIEEIEAYYNDNQIKFALKENIVQVVYAKVADDEKMRKKISQLVKSDKEVDRDSLEYYCMRYAEEYDIIDQEWIIFNDLLQRVPVEAYNPEAFLAQNKFLSINDNGYDYYINILDYRLSESTSPLSLETANIRTIILNKRKKLLIKKMQQEIYNEAMKSNDFEYY